MVGKESASKGKACYGVSVGVGRGKDGEIVLDKFVEEQLLMVEMEREAEVGLRSPCTRS
jgi:hypothetical protein